MKSEYQAWIDEHVPDYEAAYGKCAAVTQVMKEAFPELHLVRGSYHCPAWGRRDHWWLVDAEGLIVDPTACQFPSGGQAVFYEPWDESQGEPPKYSVCRDCGQEFKGDGDFCSENCRTSYMLYLQTGIL